MIIEVNHNVVSLTGSLTHNCWEVLKSRLMKVLKQHGEATIYCEGLVNYTADGLETLVEAYDFALNSPHEIDIVALSDAVENQVIQRLEARSVTAPPSLPRAG